MCRATLSCPGMCVCVCVCCFVMSTFGSLHDCMCISVMRDVWCVCVCVCVYAGATTVYCACHGAL